MIHKISNQDELNKYNYLNDINKEIVFEKNPFIKYLLYVDNSKIIGYIKYQDIVDRFEIDDIFVKEEFRNNGIAKSLMEELISIGKNQRIINITLEVREDNYSAIKLYEKYGFIKIAIRERYYGSKDGILMKREM